jgi:hypothetical protein
MPSNYWMSERVGGGGIGRRLARLICDGTNLRNGTEVKGGTGQWSG